MDGEAWWATVPGVAKSQTRQDPLEKEMVTHSSTLAWRIAWTEKPGGLQSLGSQRVRHDQATSLSFTSLSQAHGMFAGSCCAGAQEARQ